MIINHYHLYIYVYIYMYIYIIVLLTPVVDPVNSGWHPPKKASAMPRAGSASAAAPWEDTALRRRCPERRRTWDRFWPVLAGKKWRSYSWLVVDLPPEKYESQIGSPSQLLGKIKNVPNHQPDSYSLYSKPSMDVEMLIVITYNTEKAFTIVINHRSSK